MLCDVCRGRGSETKAKEDFRQFPRASESGVRDEGRTLVLSNVERSNLCDVQ